MTSVFEKSLSYETLKEAASVVRNYASEHRGLGIIACGAVVFGFGPTLRKKFFAWFNNQVTKMKNEEYEALKKEAFTALAAQKSSDPEYQKANALKILEIGVGSGTNFSFYPDGSHLTVVDPNPYFADYYMQNRKKFPNIKAETVIVSYGEDMDMVESESVDAVVITLVLCSVKDVAKVVSQIKRVLVPGGKFYFIEHIQEWDRSSHGYRWFIQNLLTWSKIWPFFFEGCNLNRNPLPFIQSVGFADVQYERLYAPMPAKVFMVASPHVRGIATK
ncbi:methyltransferase-like protein 7A [Penaeus monodon]|uniref:methyltransferase-like protein 7A n=1 Tax=Penaeus monodon TaxID=6687 RepID=UPI0018A79609|nr:methyltransferase-like protein 7A [Penaeus monodon]